MKNNISHTNSSFMELLAVALIVLKLCGVLKVSWWVILCPIWIPLVLYILLFILVCIAEAIWGER
jgi:hypothetical protein